MSIQVPLIIGEIIIDFTMPTNHTEAKIRLGGIVHAARGLWASGLKYSVAAFCPTYLVEQTRKYLMQHGCQEFILLGEVTGSPNLIAIADVKEVGHQGYEDILRDEKKIIYFPKKNNLNQFDTVIIFPGHYDLNFIFEQLSLDAIVTIDIAYDVKSIDFLYSLKGRINNLVLSTSSDLFLKFASIDISFLIDLAKNLKVKKILLKENRGGSRLFDLLTNSIEYIPANLGDTINSVGVGDVFTAVLGAYIDNVQEAAWRGMQVATVYSQTTWPDDIKRDVKRAHQIPIDMIRELGGVSLPWHERPKFQIYLAAPDFSYTNYKEIEISIAALEYHNFKVRRPVKENGEVERETPIEKLSMYYFNDVQLLQECDALFAIPINRDPGTLIEIGLAIAMGKPVITFDPRSENLNTMVVKGSSSYSSNLDICLNNMFDALSKLRKKRGIND